MQLDALVSNLDPHKTVLFLGSGTSVASGGLTAAALAAALWADLIGGVAPSEDLTELSSILSNRVGRPALIGCVRKHLSTLQPTGPMRALVGYQWASVYTTNYDCVVETACRQIQKPIVVIRSNYDDYQQIETTGHMPLLKLHGCLSQDVVDGHHGRIVITEEDYEIACEYRETMFRRLAFELSTKNVVIVGHSLRDPHIKLDIVKAAELKSKQGAPGRITLVIFERDDDRAQLYERKGISVCASSLEQLTEALARESEATGRPPLVQSGEGLLTPRQAVCTLNTPEESQKKSDTKRLFHGGEASYADIEQGLTFTRTSEDRIVDALRTGTRRFAVITGVAGVGKTSLARRIMHRLAKAGLISWEWRREFAFRAAEWLKTDTILREQGKAAVLFVDECLPFMRQVNELCARLVRHNHPALRVLVTANHAQWVPRIKTPEIFRHGIIEKLSELNDAEIADLITLLESRQDIRNLVPAKFNNMPRMARMERLRRRCKSDMFVCLKHIFSFQSLDQILLAEYAELDPTQQDIYRLVSFLEAACGTVHRQIVLRLVDIFATSLNQRLAELEGLVDEYDIDPERGIFGWRTRHTVIAQVLSQYKFADEDEVTETLRAVIEGINPTIWLELKMLREICGSEWGINQVPNPEVRVELLRRIIQIVPTERVPRHRLITALLELEQYDDAEFEIEDAFKVVRRDPPLERYRVRLYIARALHQPGIMREDKTALLRRAERFAQEAIARFPGDKRAYLTYADVGDALARVAGDKSVLNHAIHEMQRASEHLLDPDFIETMKIFMRRHGF
ncbi:MAG TPA: SIR2 family protein [Verrucomicrobiae bacterium]|nr:SIR2 family protein [Verrucomicrobiae bacterium]